MVIDINETSAYITTYSGKKVNTFDPNPATIDIYDIAHALSNICRWNGHINQFFSVAQHCIYVSYLCYPRDSLIGLLHDAAEAYIGDMINPIKHMASMKEYLSLEDKFETAIAKGLKLPTIQKTPSVELADYLVLAKEAVELGRAIPIRVRPLYEKWEGVLSIMKWECLQPEEARKKYLDRFTVLGGFKGN